MGEVDVNVGAIQVVGPSDNKTQRIAYTAGGLPEYVGFARAGTGEGAPYWQIKKFIYSGTMVIQVLWCNGNAKYDNLWTGYAGFSYS
jgi:hypothetical protein